MITIYVAECRDTGKGYVGQTSRPLRKRIGDHHLRLKNEMVLARTKSTEKANQLERFWIKKLNTLIPNGKNWFLVGNNAGSAKTGAKFKKSSKKKIIESKSLAFKRIERQIHQIVKAGK